MSALLEAVVDLESKVVETAGRMEAVSLIIPDLRTQLNEIRSAMADLAAKVAALQATPGPDTALEPAVPDPAPTVRTEAEIQAVITGEMAAVTTTVLNASQMAAWVTHFSSQANSVLGDDDFRAAVRVMVEKDVKQYGWPRAEGPVLSGQGDLASFDFEE